MAGVDPRTRATTAQFGVMKFAEPGQSGPGLAVQANDARLAGNVKHAATHKKGGADALAIDELAEASNNTKLDATQTKHGLMSKADKIKLDGISSGGAAFTIEATIPLNTFGANKDMAFVLADLGIYYKTGGAWTLFGKVAKNVTDADAIFKTPTAGDGSATLDTV